MPVIVVGADTPLGRPIIEALLPREGEVRAFVSNVEEAAELRELGVKVALGDVSDGSHVGGAALNAFSAVLLPSAATDDRERSFADTPEAVVAGWAEGLKDAGIMRAIWVRENDVPGEAIRAVVPEYAEVAVSGGPGDTAGRVAELDEAAELP
jgi:putative NADH-flavin reductase